MWLPSFDVKFLMFSLNTCFQLHATRKSCAFFFFSAYMRVKIKYEHQLSSRILHSMPLTLKLAGVLWLKSAPASATSKTSGTVLSQNMLAKKSSTNHPLASLSCMVLRKQLPVPIVCSGWSDWFFVSLLSQVMLNLKCHNFVSLGWWQFTR